MSVGLPIGDAGQRYEVWVREWETGQPRVLGWTNDRTGGALMESARKWPSVYDPVVYDRVLGQVVREEIER